MIKKKSTTAIAVLVLLLILSSHNSTKDNAVSNVSSSQSSVPINSQITTTPTSTPTITPTSTPTSTPTPIPTTTPSIEKVNVSIKFESASLIENNHVGNEWYYSASVNGEEIKYKGTKKMNLDRDSTLVISATASEDDNIPDYGMNSLELSLEELQLNKIYSYPVEVLVYENRGRYSGNSALWRFKFSIKLN